MTASSSFDGPLQNQMMLMKLVHELERRPNFGLSYDGDPDSDVQLWLARVGAILDRMSVDRSLNFRAAQSTLTQYWVPAINSIQIQVRQAIEELKLGLELHQNEEIGKIYDAGQEFQFARDVLGIVVSAEVAIFVIDPYFDAATFSMLFSAAHLPPIRILMDKGAEGVKEVARRFEAEFAGAVEIRRSKSIHDRVIFIDDKQCWIVGSSVKDGGRKPTYLMPLQHTLVSDKRRIYEDVWQGSSLA